MINSLRLMTFGPLTIRIVIGILFVINGWPKLLDIKQTQDYFIMISLPQELAVMIGLLEVVGGILLAAGILTRIVAFLFAIEMIGAFIVLNVSHAIPIPKGYESALISIPILFLAISISLVLTGPGRISIELDILKRELIPYGKKIVSDLRE
jgi:putative oxidoreductase